jgi:tetratricopeptide (TPR) repeat protein
VKLTRTLLMLLASCGVVRGQTLQQAEALWRAHDYQNAVKAFDALIAANPKNAEYRIRFGQFFFERYDPEEAAKLFQEALEIDPKNAKAHLGLAVVLADQFSGKASEEADKALELDPKLAAAHALKARMALEDDDPKKAVEEADSYDTCIVLYRKKEDCGGHSGFFHVGENTNASLLWEVERFRLYLLGALEREGD